ncbi:aldo/keto reductase [Actinokineospora iranica]|uniref:Predicted oxidoreductase n=1 Tax=Actinokineospora iranica TaxID=1271860 RepID=A0A1G6LJD0_9PSEU|nr:aldo/keto reductase [Actinokineospora iranica]SDC43067.1 Predicted oxidoreductase [Actinokineospora iranica]
MRYRLLGRTGLRISELFLGAMRFTTVDESRRVLDRYADAGGNVIDTANAYRDSEAIVGEIIAGRRDRFVLATKYTMSRDGSDPNAAGNHRKNLVLSLESSLRLLRTDYIDLYWAHIWDPLTPIEETMRALDDAVRAGKILHVGISDAPAWVTARANTLAECRDWTPFAAVQVPYNLIQRDIEREILPMAEGMGLTVATWNALGHGSLTREPGPTADALRAVAAELGATPAQVAMAWIRTRSRAIHPILGARTDEQLADSLGVLDLALPEDAARRLEATAEFTPGFPADFVGATAAAVYGEAGARVDA